MFVVGVGREIKFCRTCEIKHDEQFIDLTDIYVQRDINRHLFQLEIIKGYPELEKEYGINYPCPLLNLNNFDICKCMLHDPMHVLIEGVFIKQLENLLKYANIDRGIKLEEINTRISSFKYYTIDTHDKPNIIEKEHILKGSFAKSVGQMQTLKLSLPFILGDLFTEYEEKWLNLMNLHQILNLCFSFFMTIKQFDNKMKKLSCTGEI